MKNSPGDKLETQFEIDILKVQSNEIEAKIISMKKAILEDSIVDGEIEEKIELTLEVESYKLEEQSDTVENKSEVIADLKLDDESSDAELLESEEEVGGNPDLFGEGMKIGEYSPMPNDDQSNDKESI